MVTPIATMGTGMFMPPAALSTSLSGTSAGGSVLADIVRRSAIVAALALALPGCATITTDDHQSIVVTSDPPGATCRVREGGAVVAVIETTPATVLVGKSRHDIGIDCSRTGYYPGAAVLEPHFQERTLGNIIYGHAVGVIVDISTGAVNEYPHWVKILMQPLRPVGAERMSQAELDQRQALRNEGVFLRQ